MATSNTKRGYFYKQSGTGGNWKKRYFVLDNSTLLYFKDEESTKPKGCIELTKGRGVREKHQCAVEWPSAAKKELCFGLAIESRTYYIYGSHMQTVRDWVTELQQIIERVGKKTDDWRKDVQGKPESKGSKIFRGSVKLMTKVVKMAASESGMLSEDELAAVEAAADAVHNQADADPNTSWKDRVKIGVKDGAGMAGDGLNIGGDLFSK